MTTKISVVNQKGGAGKTSLAAQICIALTYSGKKVLAVDADPQGGMSEALIKDYDFNGLTHNLVIGLQIKPLTVMNNDVQMDIIPSSYELDKMYVTLDHLAFKRSLKDIENDYDYIIFDTPPTMQGITRAAINYSDKIFIPTEVSKNAMGPTLYTVKCIEELEREAKVIFVDNMSHSTTRYKKSLFEEYKNRLDGNFAGNLRRTDTIKKIVSGDIDISESKFNEYLRPVLEIVEGKELGNFKTSEVPDNIARVVL